MPHSILIPDIPLFPLDQALHVCQWLHGLTERELTYWPRRNVLATPQVYPNIPCPGECGGVYIAMLCLN